MAWRNRSGPARPDPGVCGGASGTERWREQHEGSRQGGRSVSPRPTEKPASPPPDEKTRVDPGRRKGLRHPRPTERVCVAPADGKARVAPARREDPRRPRSTERPTSPPVDGTGLCRPG
ncbi:hypothetical protein GCM10010349_05720 [Streptomyces flavofungini]|nr:hypothetical protein GCM10010349_05720 [Streptomyces flavofungini]